MTNREDRHSLCGCDAGCSLLRLEMKREGAGAVGGAGAWATGLGELLTNLQIENEWIDVI